jgi:hypothetical protein
VRAWLYVFNDAGVGKDRAGIAALDLLDADGIAAVTVSHDSARIGEASDAWQHGVLSHLNAAAVALGLLAAQPLSAQLRAAAARGRRGGDCARLARRAPASRA